MFSLKGKLWMPLSQREGDLQMSAGPLGLRSKLQKLWSSPSGQDADLLYRVQSQTSYYFAPVSMLARALRKRS